MSWPHFAIPHVGFNFYAFFLASAVFAGEIYLQRRLKSVPEFGRIFFAIISMLFTTGSILVAVKFLPSDLVSSSLCGGIGFMASALLFDKFYNNSKLYKFLDITKPSKTPKLFFTKNCIIVMPLVYAIAKLGCTYAGCCHGFTYTGPFSLIYNNPEAQGEFFPVQPLETLVFLAIFFFAQKIQKPIPILTICVIAKFFLDFLRYTHADNLISPNQIACLAALALLAINYIYQKRILLHKQEN